MDNMDLNLSSNDIVAEINNSCLIITMDRAKKLNALTSAMYADLNTCLNYAAETKDIRAAVITSNSDNFTAGNDITDFLNNPNLDYTHPVVIFLKTIANFKKPLIASVRGAAVGIGTTMLLHCDFVYASPDSYFQMPFTQLGLVPEAGSSYILPLLANKSVANDLLILGEKFTAEQAISYGVINGIGDNPSELAIKACEKICKLPVNAVLKTKKLLKSHFKEEIDKTIDAELEEFAKCLASDEAKSAFNAFLQRG